MLLLVYTTRQRNFALYITGVIFTCKCFKFGLNATGLSQSHFRNLSACSIRNVIVIYQLVNWSSSYEGRDPTDPTSVTDYGVTWVQTKD